MVYDPNKWMKNNPEKANLSRAKAKAKLLSQDPDYYKRYQRTPKMKLYHQQHQRQVWKERGADAKRIRRKYWIKQKYGITSEEWDAMLAAQQNKCACCGSSSPKHKQGWRTDHCHSTGKVRGIVCHPCNVMLVTDVDKVRLRKALAYLERTEEGQFC